jgi:predicted RNase H-like nuclease (RuvC/YqgF family)
MKLLLKLLGVSDYIEELKRIQKYNNEILEQQSIELQNLESEVIQLRQQILNQDRLKANLEVADERNNDLVQELQETRSQVDNLLIKITQLEEDIYFKEQKLDNLKCFVLDNINQLAKDLHNYD